MISLKVVRWRNFLSYGNKFTEYYFKKGITRVTGANGFGKCLDPTTEIEIEIEDNEIKEKFLDFINTIK